VPRFLLDGRPAQARAGQTLLEACREGGVHLPTLCHFEGLSAPASCRLCLVRVRGLPRPVPACATRIWEGMEVATDGPDLRAHRRAVVELILAGGRHECGPCPASGDCELQELARELGVDHLPAVRPPARAPVDATHPRFLLDPNRCVLCTRCVRACAEVERAGTLSVAGRGAGAHIAVDGGVPFGASWTCTDCGRCAEACPTGAIGEVVRGAQGLRRRRTRPPVPPAPPRPRPERRARLATLQLGGCFGCHVSLLDLDERLLELAARADLVFSPLAAEADFPEGVDLCLVEGAVAREGEADLLRRARARSRLLVAMGDCAASGGPTSLRDGCGGAEEALRCAWAPAEGAAPPRDPGLPALLARVAPVAEVVPIDLHLPGCPPPPDLLWRAVSDLLAGEWPDLAGLAVRG
jgi:bidirectional [NiFe] hydrogenase diaphorase subunit